jgi:signal transduction histidine kinase
MPDVDYVVGVQGDTRHRVVQVAITPLHDAAAQITGAVLTLTDLTERMAGQATLARAADALAQITRETLARIAVTQAQDNRDLTRSNTALEQQATLARVADALAEATRETLAREAGVLAQMAVTQAQDNRDLTRSNTELEQQATLARAADTLAQVTRETLAIEAGALARKVITQAQDNRDLTRSNTNLERQATLARAADAQAQVTRETLAIEAGVLAQKAVTQAQDNRDLTRSNSGLEQFASVASHDLQEPLRKIQAFGDRLKRVEGANLSQAGNDYLERMQHAAARMQVLINDLLTYARVSAGQGAVVPVDLAAIMQAVLTDLETRIAQSGGQVNVGPLPIIEGDPLRLRQLLQNLISNALKFLQPDVPPIVTVSAVLLPREDSEDAGPEADAAPPAWLRLTLQDNGIGFEQKHAERIFEVFKRLHGRSAYEGTGIGLALCRQIVEQHGGHITAISTPGQGATFLVTLPLRQAQGVDTP